MADSAEPTPTAAHTHHSLHSAPSRLLWLARAALLATAVTPIVLLPNFFFPFVTTRNIFFRLYVEFALYLAVLGLGLARFVEIAWRDIIFRLFVAYLVAISLAAVFGASPWHSLFGDFERMGGVWAWVHLLLYYTTLRVCMRDRDWERFYFVIVAVADIVVFWGVSGFIAARLGNAFFQTSIIAGSTIGNPGLLAPYLLICFGVAGWRLTAVRGAAGRLFFGASALFILFALAGTLNRSSQLGLIVGAGAAAIVYFLATPDKRRLLPRYSALLVTIGLSVLILAVLVRRGVIGLPAPLTDRWSAFMASPIDYSRTIEWRVALRGFLDRPFFGYGPENHQVVVSHHFDPRIYDYATGGVFDRAHNAWLELMATSGIFGITTMAALWVASLVEMFRARKAGTLSASGAAVICGLLAGYAVYLTFWFFDINSVFLWVSVLAWISSADGRSRHLDESASVHLGRIKRPMSTIAATAILGLVIVLHAIVPLRAANQLNFASQPGPVEQRLDAFGMVMRSSAPQTFHTYVLYYQFLRNTTGVFLSGPPNSLLRKEYELALNRGLIEGNFEIARSPEDDRVYLDVARFNLLASLFFRDRQHILVARDELLHAIRISPRRPEARILLSGVFQTLADSAKARAQIDSALLLAPQYGPTYFYAARMISADGNVDSTASLLESGLNRHFAGTPDVYERTVIELSKHGKDARAAKLDEEFLEVTYVPLYYWGKGRPPRIPDLSPAADRLANRLPVLYLRAGETDSAVATARVYASIRPHAVDAARRFEKDILSGEGVRWLKREYLLAEDDSASQDANTLRR